MKLTLTDYSTTALQTMSDKTTLTVATLGLTGEAGEVAEYVKKWLGHGHELDIKAIANEIGDVLWYINAIAHFIDIPLEQIARRNLGKLADRYPEGFSTKASRERYTP